MSFNSSRTVNYFATYNALVIERLMSGKTKLFEHQKKALFKMLEKAARGELNPSQRTPNRGAGYLLMGVGTGKSVVIECLPFVLGEYMTGRQVLVVVDNCTLRSRILQDFPTHPMTHVPLYDQWPLYNLEILLPGIPPPQIAELKAEQWRSYAFSLETADILVVNRQFLITLVQRGDLDPAQVGLLIIDEAHHVSASTYRTIINYFDRSLLCFLTGSRFRSDSRPIPHIRYTSFDEESEQGQWVMRYSPVADFEFNIQDAWKLNPPPIKRLMYQEATSKAFLVEEANGEEVQYEPEAFFAKAESHKEWFRKILLADSFCLPVLEKAVEILALKRTSGQPHAMIVRALNIPHAHRLFQLLDSFPLLQGRVGLVHSEREGFDLAGRPSDIYKQFFSGELICLVHCSMVGEGFSHPWASVSVCLCVMRSLTVGEQEWGRIIRRVPGPSPDKFPNLEHPNWGVVVSHEALGIGELFERFLQGQVTAPISGYWDEETGAWSPLEAEEKPKLVVEYEAGETTIQLSNTRRLEPGDIIVLSIPVAEEASPETSIPKFNLSQELGGIIPKKSGEIMGTAPASNLPTNEPIVSSVSEEKGLYNVFKEAAKDLLSQIEPETSQKAAEEPQESIQDRAVNLISDRLSEIRATRSLSVQIEAILDDKTVQITPVWSNLPTGTELVRKPMWKEREEVIAHFKQHIGLDWMVVVNGEAMTYSDYRRKTVLQQKGFELDRNGELCRDGIPLRELMPEGTYEIFVKGLEAEIERTEVQVPHAIVSCRPDEVKKSLQAKYGTRVRAEIFGLLDETWLIPDGRAGRSLIEHPLECLLPLMVREEGGVFGGAVAIADIDFDYYKNNGQLLHKVVFAYIKRRRNKKWSEHSTESEFEAAVRFAKHLLADVRAELMSRRRNFSGNSSQVQVIDWSRKVNRNSGSETGVGNGRYRVNSPASSVGNASSMSADDEIEELPF
ncbi:MAG: DEAD/DEAH box helicase [Actinomycetota bacterium]